MPQHLYVLRPTRLGMVKDGPTDHEAAIVSQHFAHLQHLTESGTMILVGRTQNADERVMGLAIFKADSDDHARQIMNSDPAIINGIMTAEVFPYRVALIREANALE
jgi:uncharacterized protein YciI